MTKSLSKREYEVMSGLALKNVKSITLDEASRLLNMKREYLKVIFHRLEKKKWLERLERGNYLVVPMEGQYGWSEHPFIVVSRLLSTYYISYRTALAHHGLTEQIPRTIYAATLDRKSKSGMELQDYVFRFIRINERKFYGYQKIKIENHEVNVASAEKAIVDCLDKEQYAGTIIETAKALSHGSVNIDQIRRHAIRMKNASLIRRLGYLLDLMTLDSKGLEEHIGKHRDVYLSLKLPRQEIGRSKKWKLIINVRDEDLLEW
jgi:predicted transcriptional regulator of viral defense system